ncbi:hypothetical protein SAMN05518849_108165 [Sphingobium sp. AP50]|nr:hypothetical protein SAMN05518849_108165 [Sphingobium sp. AP50]
MGMANHASAAMKANVASAPVTGPGLTDRALARRRMHAAAGVKVSERNAPALTVAAPIGRGRKDRVSAHRKTRAAIAATASVQTVHVSTVVGPIGHAQKDRALAPPKTHAATGAKTNGQNGPASIAADRKGLGRKDRASAHQGAAPKAIAPNGLASIGDRQKLRKAIRPASRVERSPPPQVRPTRIPPMPRRKARVNRSASPNCWPVQV